MSIRVRLKGFARKHKVITALLCVVLAITLFFTVKDWIETPTDLGSKMEYIGKHEFGCAPFPLFFVCFGNSSYSYYFATDMNSDELKSYFKRARYVQPGPVISEAYAREDLYFKALNSDAEFSIWIEADTKGTDSTVTVYHLKSTNKPYIISIDDSEYQLAKESL